jgi:hypothetical protein
LAMATPIHHSNSLCIYGQPSEWHILELVG